MYKGERHRVTCKELGAATWTKEGSGKLADDWWRRKLAELRGGALPPEVVEVQQVVGTHRVQGLRDLVEKGRAAAAMLDVLERAAGEVVPPTVVGTNPDGHAVAVMPDADDGAALLMKGELPADAIAAGFPVADAAQRLRDVRHDAAKLDVGPGRKDNTVRGWGERWLVLLKGEMKPVSFAEIRDFVGHLAGKIGTGLDVSKINEQTVQVVYLWLRDGGLSDGRKKKFWGFFRRFVRYLWGLKLVEMPRNLDGYTFTVSAKKVPTYPLSKVRTVLDDLKPRLRLYALLGLNCGFTNSDIGRLRKDEVDLSSGRIIRKRGKTSDHDNVPTVSYRLWPETLELLRECWSDHPVFALTSMDNTPLWEQRMGDKDDTAKKDMVAQQFKRAECGLTLKAFRKIGATLIEGHATYGRYVSHYLGHSPKTVADKHYAAPSAALFDKVMTWLRSQIFTA